ncbi:hypothetical protein [Helicobacter acinonychis]|uniref:Periplasmic protein n=1 Tax=Helicobacter acinonychis (strain Sheeba) TaxID=382638 RepID=Q17XH4_HELAH|nr:hypothetical protein [Helicobacter acinonychis]CAJ99652.1 conserved hypothetical protein [Helicobacter acinonychis str. Sheeba]STP04216.1 Putative periplasmic protein [Helicobacter acinonychis]
MKNLFLAFIVGGVFLNADALDDKIENLMGERSYHINKHFLEHLFKNRKDFYQMGRLDSLKLLNTLKENGLLSFNFDKPSILKIIFKASSNPLAFAKSINNSLSMMGYSYVLPIKMQSSSDENIFSYELKTEYVLDPNILIETMKGHGFNFVDIRRISLKEWEYDFTLQEIKLPNARALILNSDPVEFKEASGKYWLSMNQKAYLKISSNNPLWQPKIIFYDENLKIIQIIAKENRQQKIALNLLNGVRFIQITDAKNPIILKNGISVVFDAMP